MSYEMWIKTVDGILNSLIWMGHMDIPDWNWRDEFESDSSPREAVEAWHEDMSDELGLPELEV